MWVKRLSMVINLLLGRESVHYCLLLSFTSPLTFLPTSVFHFGVFFPPVQYFFIQAGLSVLSDAAYFYSEGRKELLIIIGQGWYSCCLLMTNVMVLYVTKNWEFMWIGEMMRRDKRKDGRKIVNERKEWQGKITRREKEQSENGRIIKYDDNVYETREDGEKKYKTGKRMTGGNIKERINDKEITCKRLKRGQQRKIIMTRRTKTKGNINGKS